jgi:P-type E1-E2 ATPase
MPTYEIPGRGVLDLSTLVLDLNGTVALDGELISGVDERVNALKERGMDGYLITADTRGRGAETADALGLTLHRLHPGQESSQKRAFVQELGAEHIVAIGAGANDAAMLEVAAVGIVVLQAEGAAMATLYAADLVVPDIHAALDLLLKPQRLIATLRQ